jgi:hypothetical protein
MDVRGRCVRVPVEASADPTEACKNSVRRLVRALSERKAPVVRTEWGIHRESYPKSLRRERRRGHGHDIRHDHEQASRRRDGKGWQSMSPSVILRRDEASDGRRPPGTARGPGGTGDELPRLGTIVAEDTWSRLVRGDRGRSPADYCRTRRPGGFTPQFEDVSPCLNGEPSVPSGN